MGRKTIILMGVSGCGKTTIGKILAQEMHVKFIDGDDLHPRANIQKMARGNALNDDDREPWLERLNDVAYSLSNKNETGIIVCSALKRRYRDRLRKDNENMVFLHLKASYNTVMANLEARTGHFMPTELLKSQFDTLEEPGPDEKDVICVDIDTDIENVVSRVVALLN